MWSLRYSIYRNTRKNGCSMKAVVYKGHGDPVLEERKKPEILDPRDAIVKVTLTTICSSDIHILNGAVPRAKENVILGHEFVGVVEQTGSAVKNMRPGDRVAVNVETFCGECFYCQNGWVNNCTDPQGGWALGCRIDGGQAEYARIPYADCGLTFIPDSVSDEQALFTGDLMSTGYWAAQLGEIREGDCVAIIGAGPTGLCAMMAAKLRKPGRVIAIDLKEDRLNFAKGHGLADVVVNPRNENVEETIRELSDRGGADVVIEAAGGKDTFQTAWKLARPAAVVCLVAMYEENQTLPLPQMYGKNLVFKTGGVDAADCGEIMSLIASGTLDPSILITHRASFEQILEAYQAFRRQEAGMLKWAIRMD